jgi:hypothetical protein
VTDQTGADHDEEPQRFFEAAWSAIDVAVEARDTLARCWQDLCDAESFDAEIVPLTESSGRLDVLVFWPPALVSQADAAAASFAQHVKEAFDEALVAAATAVSGAIEVPDPRAHELPLCRSEAAFAQLLADGALRGLRPDQIRVVKQFQPFGGPDDGDSSAWLRDHMSHLAQMLTRGSPETPRVAAWAHSATPEFYATAPAAHVRSTVCDDGVLQDRFTVAEFSCTGIAARRVDGNPMIAFDAVFNDPPWPRDPDDNLMHRSRSLIAAAREFVRGLERSVGHHRSDASRPQFASFVPKLEETPWGVVDLAEMDQGPEISAALDESDLGIGVHFGPGGERTVLLRSGDTTFARPIPPATPLPPGLTAGTGAEASLLHAASFWGLPDFVMRPKIVRKGKGSREIGDGTVVVGKRGLAIQSKARECPSSDGDKESRWIDKKINEARSQASGALRNLKQDNVTLVNQRGRTVPIVGSEIEWLRVIILDHPDPPELEIHTDRDTEKDLVVVLRRDWDFLFDQLRSASAVADYLFRIADEGVHRLGDEPARYFELAQRDTDCVTKPAPWTQAFGGVQQLSHPLLPTTPPARMDGIGHTVYRLILEDVARSPLNGGEADRLLALSLLDRCPVAERGVLGRLLLSHLDDVAAVDEGTKWKFRRMLLDHGALQLAFGTSSSLSQPHQEAFRYWTMLRHHDLTEANLSSPRGVRRTVAVLLTPRLDGRRPWDTSVLMLQGDIDLQPDEVAQMRRLWSTNEAA